MPGSATATTSRIRASAVSKVVASTFLMFVFSSATASVRTSAGCDRSIASAAAVMLPAPIFMFVISAVSQQIGPVQFGLIYGVLAGLGGK